MAKIPFFQNDRLRNEFYHHDNRRKIWMRKSWAISSGKVCAHKLSAGADGLVAI